MRVIAESRMSSLTHEWHLKRENGIKYWIQIRNFTKKMNWRSGKEVYSRRFKISESVFRIDVYPNGISAKEKGHVSVYLCNESNWRVKLSDVTFAVVGHKRICESDYYQAEGSWGLDQFVSHEQIEDEGLLDEDGEFTLEIDVQLQEEEGVASRPIDIEGDDLLAVIGLGELL